MQALASDGGAVLQHEVTDLQARLEERTQEVTTYQTTVAELVRNCASIATLVGIFFWPACCDYDNCGPARLVCMARA